MADFASLFKNPIVFLSEIAAWEIVDSHVFSVRNMSDQELREAIVQDILAVTMWEKHFGAKLHFNMKTLLRFIEDPVLQQRVSNQFTNREIVGFFDYDYTTWDVRIRSHPKTLQAAMDYCGVWYSDYDMPEGALIVNEGAVDRAIEELGSIENLIKSISFDLAASEIIPMFGDIRVVH